jgi:hypothetical protein
MSQQFVENKLLLQKSNNRTIYLNGVEKLEFHDFFTEEGVSDIQLRYGIWEESKRDATSYSIVAQFIPDSPGRYKIVERLIDISPYEARKIPFIKVWKWREAPSFDGAPEFVGFSDNQSLRAVKAWNFWQEHYIAPVIYDSSQVDEQPQLDNLLTEENYEEIIKSEMTKIEQWRPLTDSVSGFIRFTFVVEANLTISHFAVDSINLDKREFVPEICVAVNWLIRYLNYPSRCEWTNPGKINGVPVAVRQYVTIHF